MDVTRTGRLPLAPGVYRFRGLRRGHAGRYRPRPSPRPRCRSRRTCRAGRSADGRAGPGSGRGRVPAGRLTARRETAAAGLAFEFAGRLQAELEALAWITGEQRVTQAVPCDLDMHGWADGMLVGFEIRGRLSGWRQRPCGAPAAGRHLAQSPPGWADFAGRAATPAARLR